MKEWTVLLVTKQRFVMLCLFRSTSTIILLFQTSLGYAHLFLPMAIIVIGAFLSIVLGLMERVSGRRKHRENNINGVAGVKNSTRNSSIDEDIKDLYGDLEAAKMDIN
jgi:hypothetical protein